MRRLALILIALLAAAPFPLAAERPLFETWSDQGERPLQHLVKPNAAMVRLVFRALDPDDPSMLDSCLMEYHLAPRDYGALMYAIPIRSGPGRTLWFVRGSPRHFCLGLYGAHVFHFFLIDERQGSRPRYRLVYAAAGDYASVYRTRHHGLNDVRQGGCMAAGARKSEWPMTAGATGRQSAPTGYGTWTTVASGSGNGTLAREVSEPSSLFLICSSFSCKGFAPNPLLD